MNLFLYSQAECGSPDHTQAADFDKKGKTRRVKSTARDAHFYEDFRSLWLARHSAAAGGTSVTYPPLHTHPIPPATPNLKQFDRFMRQQRHDLALLPGPTYRKPAPWRDLSLPMQALYFHFAAAQAGPVVAFSLRLDPAIEEKARAHASAECLLHDRMAAELRQMFGRRVEHWFVLENRLVGLGAGLHLHGEVMLPAEDAERCRKAFRRAAGEWERVRQHQAHTKADPDPGWVSYVLKDAAWNRKGWRYSGIRKFEGNSFASTNAIRSAARRLYEQDRAQVRIVV